jgi:hypothetical protein
MVYPLLSNDEEHKTWLRCKVKDEGWKVKEDEGGKVKER